MEKVLVVGTSRSGLSCASLLEKLNIKYYLYNDDETINEVNGISIIHYPPEDVDTVILSPGVAIDSPIAMWAKKKGIEIIGEVEFATSYIKQPIIAITGTNGKTTTTALVGHIFESVFNTKVVGNIGIPITSIVDQEKDVVVAEISSFQLETIKNFRPHIAVLLNVTPDHLNRHYTFENYIKTKYEITKNQLHFDFIIVNKDCDNLSRYELKTEANKLYFSTKSKADIYLNNDEIYYKDEKVCDLSDIKLVGSHNIENVLAAIGCSKLMNIDNYTIVKALRTFYGVKHRLQFVREFEGVTYYNDSKATNPESAIKAIESMTKPTVLIAGGYDKNADYNEWLEKCKDRLKALVLFGETATRISEIAETVGISNVIITNSLKEAVDISREISKVNENILLSPACASWDMYNSYEERGDEFIDIVNSLK